jgi:hypothetical protein
MQPAQNNEQQLLGGRTRKQLAIQFIVSFLSKAMSSAG